MRYLSNLILGLILVFIACCTIAGIVSFVRWDLIAFTILFKSPILRIVLVIGAILGIYLGVTDEGDF